MAILTADNTDDTDDKLFFVFFCVLCVKSSFNAEGQKTQSKAVDALFRIGNTLVLHDLVIGLSEKPLSNLIFTPDDFFLACGMVFALLNGQRWNLWFQLLFPKRKLKQ